MTFGVSRFDPTSYTGPKQNLVPLRDFPRQPTTTDKKYPIGQHVIIGKDPISGTEGDIWYLAYFDSSGDAIWHQLSIGAGSPGIDTITSNSGGAVSPDGGGDLDFLGDNTSGINIVGTPASNLQTVFGLQSSESQRGTVELATAAETTTGTSNSLAVHPSGLNTKLGAQTANGLIYGQGGAGSNLGALAEATNGQLPIGSTGNPPTLATLTAGTNVTITNGAGSITIDANSQDFIVNITALDDTDSPYVVLSTDFYMTCNVTSGVLTIQLPNAPTTGRIFVVKDANGNCATNNITVTTVGGVVTIDGSTSFVMNTNYESANFLFNGTSYEVW